MARYEIIRAGELINEIPTLIKFTNSLTVEQMQEVCNLMDNYCKDRDFEFFQVLPVVNGPLYIIFKHKT